MMIMGSNEEERKIELREGIQCLLNAANGFGNLGETWLIPEAVEDNETNRIKDVVEKAVKFYRGKSRLPNLGGYTQVWKLRKESDWPSHMFVIRIMTVMDLGTFFEQETHTSLR
mmetsp:Transcript_33073/g.46958  ORF Transcript_33073/g.46958 Transcript_33073/m.46958 type:complete len:114 (-) Transcript_33073:83-424(-)